MNMFMPKIYLKNRDELLMRINYIADIIRQTPNSLEKTWNSLHRRIESASKLTGVTY